MSVLKVWMDGHGRHPGTYFQYVLVSSHFLGHFGGILENVHALLFSHFKHWTICSLCMQFVFMAGRSTTDIILT